jgi:hypothetical protein
MYPRSKQHWTALRNFVANILLQNVNLYHTSHIGPIYRETGASAGSASGNYTALIMRNPRYYGSGVPDWKVPDNGRWWLRDSTYSEPNGDYAAYGHLGNRGIPVNYIGEYTLIFNDLGNYTQTTGSNYIISTNAKP